MESRYNKILSMCALTNNDNYTLPAIINRFEIDSRNPSVQVTLLTLHTLPLTHAGSPRRLLL